MNTNKPDREYLTAISVEAGVITLIEPNGNIGYYRQRGIGPIDTIKKAILIRRNLLHPKWNTIKELPKHWSIAFEDEEIMGKAKVTFTLPKDLK